MEAFLARFELYVIERSQADVMPRLKSWRSLAAAQGFEPGPGTVRVVGDGEMPPEVARLLAKARAKVDGPAPAHVRARAVEAVASHFDGDLGFAEELVGSIEAKGPLPAAIAHALADARKVIA